MLKDPEAGILFRVTSQGFGPGKGDVWGVVGQLVEFLLNVDAHGYGEPASLTEDEAIGRHAALLKLATNLLDRDYPGATWRGALEATPRLALERVAECYSPRFTELAARAWLDRTALILGAARRRAMRAEDDPGYNALWSVLECIGAAPGPDTRAAYRVHSSVLRALESLVKV